MVRLQLLKVLIAQRFFRSAFTAAVNIPYHPNLSPRGSPACQQSENRAAVAPKENLWIGLSKSERDELTDCIHEWANRNIVMLQSNSTMAYLSGPVCSRNPVDHGLNPTSGAWNITQPLNSTTDSTPEVDILDLIYPKKADALAYIEGSRPAPLKYAKFILRFQDVYQKFSIGPLPLSNSTQVLRMDWDATRSGGGKVIKKSGEPESDLNGLSLLRNITSSMTDILEDLIGADASVSPTLDRKKSIMEGDKWIQWFCFSVNTTDDASWILQHGIYFKIDTSGPKFSNSSTLLAIVYNGKVYESVSAFRVAWSAPGFEKIPIPKNGDWTSMDRSGKPFPYDVEPGPRTISTSKRFTIDLKNQYVQWMGFSFYMSMSQQLGLGLHNINYEGERIIYELQMQEAIALYSSNDPVRAQTFYLDSAEGGFGGTINTLVPGWDCPETASYLDTPFMPGSICVFERDAGFPLARHRGGNYVTVVKNNILVIRTISTIGNYDYMFDYQFFYDGSMEVTVRASGYIEGTNAGGNEEHGYRIHDALSGAMHDHIINFKLDLDINGTANTMERVDIKAVTESFVGSKAPINTMKIEKSFITNEDHGKINWAPNAASMYVVVNKEAKNPLGEYRGFRIAPGMGSPAHLTATNSSVAQNSVNFAKNHLYVTKRKDTEPNSASTMNILDVENPHVDFDKFFDGESIDQEDIVVWFNLGMHHVPHTGDLPVTIFQAAQSSMVISPHNFLMNSPSKRVTQAVTVDMTSDDNSNSLPSVNYNGADVQLCSYDLTSRFDLAKYMNDSFSAVY